MITPTYTTLVDSNGVDAALSIIQQIQRTDELLLHLFYLAAALGLIAVIGVGLWLAIRVLP